MTSSPWIRWITRLAVLASFGLIGWFLWRHAAELLAVDWRALAGPAALSLLWYGMALGLQSATWIRLWSILTGVSWGWEDVRAYMMSHLMRRLPGAPWYMAGRAMLYRERGPEAARAAVVVSLLEWGGQILTALIWVAGMKWGWPGAGLVLGILALGVPWLRSWSWPRRWVQLQRFSLSSLYLSLGGYLLQWGLADLMFYGFLRALTPAWKLDFIQTGGLWAISGVISSLAVFAPAGLGIRELSLVALLDPYTGPGYAALVALLMRVMFTLGDLVWGLGVNLGTLKSFRPNTP